MQAIVIHAAKDLRVEDLADGEPGPGEVKVRVARGGICGSDLHYYNHGGFGAVRLKHPMILGHEVSGIVESLGANVEGLSEGDLVAISPSRPCGACRYCLDGLPNHCLNMRFYGSAMPMPHIQGAFAETLVVQASQCVRAPDGLTPAETAMAEPLSVALHVIRRAGEMIGKRVLVTGCGPIGVLTIMAARRAGAREIVATDIAELPLRHAELAGAEQALNVAENPEALAPWRAEKGSFDVLLEASGAPAALADAILAVRPRGVVVQLGLGGDDVLPLSAIVTKELDLRGSFRFHEEFRWSVQLMGQGLIDVKPVITHIFPLSRALEAFETASQRLKAMKTQIAFA